MFGSGRRRWLVAALGAVAVVVVVTGLLSTPAEDADEGPPYALVPGDVAEVADVTVPDDSTVHTGQRFWKVWKLSNTGSVPWKGRYLQRQNQPTGPDDDCWTRERIPIGLTQPGNSAEIGAAVTTRTTPGFCLTEWKVVDGSGRVMFPGARPVHMTVRVEP